MSNSESEQGPAHIEDLNMPTSQPVDSSLARLYSDTTPLSIADLSFTDMTHYAAILSRRPSCEPFETASGKRKKHEYLSQTKLMISRLPAHLKEHRSSAFSGLTRSGFERTFHRLDQMVADSIPRPSTLCKLHEQLCRQLIADMVSVVKMEVEDFLNDLLQDIGGRKKLDEDLSNMVSYLEDICAAWLVDQEFSRLYRRSPRPRWANSSKSETGEHGCDACILARIGSDPAAICALRAVTLARMPKKVLSGERRSPRLEWISAWIKALGNDDGGLVLMTASRLGHQLRKLKDGQDIVMVYAPILHDENGPKDNHSRTFFSSSTSPTLFRETTLSSSSHSIPRSHYMFDSCNNNTESRFPTRLSCSIYRDATSVKASSMCLSPEMMANDGNALTMEEKNISRSSLASTGCKSVCSQKHLSYEASIPLLFSNIGKTTHDTKETRDPASQPAVDYAPKPMFCESPSSAFRDRVGSDGQVSITFEYLPPYKEVQDATSFADQHCQSPQMPRNYMQMPASEARHNVEETEVRYPGRFERVRRF